MHRMARAGVAALAAAALGGSALCGSALGAAPPTPRGGLWEAKISGGPMNAVAMTMKSCVDPARAGSPFVGAGASSKACGQAAQISPALGGGWAYHQVCRPGGGMTMDTRGVATGDFNASYVIHIVTRMTPAPTPALAESRTTVAARWLGPCPAGMKPGDALMNGRRISASPGR